MTKLLTAMAILAVLFALPVSANPGTNGLTKDAVVGSSSGCKSRPGTTCFFAWGDSAYTGNSEVFTIQDADICFNSDNADTTDSGATVTIYRVISSDDANGSMIPTASGASTLTHSSGDCFRAVTGRYWIETTTDPTDTAKVAVVTVTGRNR